MHLRYAASVSGIRYDKGADARRGYHGVHQGGWWTPATGQGTQPDHLETLIQLQNSLVNTRIQDKADSKCLEQRNHIHVTYTTHANQCQHLRVFFLQQVSNILNSGVDDNVVFWQVYMHRVCVTPFVISSIAFSGLSFSTTLSSSALMHLCRYSPISLTSILTISTFVWSSIFIAGTRSAPTALC